MRLCITKPHQHYESSKKRNTDTNIPSTKSLCDKELYDEFLSWIIVPYECRTSPRFPPPSHSAQFSRIRSFRAWPQAVPDNVHIEKRRYGIWDMRNKITRTCTHLEKHRQIQTQTDADRHRNRHKQLPPRGYFFALLAFVWLKQVDPSAWLRILSVRVAHPLQKKTSINRFHKMAY